jgi:hypothetical protein
MVPTSITAVNSQLEIPFVSYYNEDIREIMIKSVASAINASSAYPQNTKSFTYNNNPCFECVGGGSTSSSIDITYVSGITQTMFWEQTDETDGNLFNSQLQLQLHFETDSETAFLCSAMALSADLHGELALFPPLAWLAPAVGPMALAFSFDCLTEELNSDD